MYESVQTVHNVHGQDQSDEYPWMPDDTDEYVHAELYAPVILPEVSDKN